MAATPTTPPAAARGRARLGDMPLAPAALGAALAVALLYAAFASGAIGISEGSRLQAGVAVIAFAAVGGLLFGRDLRFDPARGGLAGLGLLAGFVAWAALSVTWSVAPDETWLEVNRAIAYVLVVALAIALGSSIARSAERVALGWLAIATAISLYALGGKLFPWLDIPGLIDLNHTERFSRLRAPLDYWNALAMVCVLAVPIAVRAAADLGARDRTRLAALLTLVPLLTTLALTYSRGGLLALAAALALLIGIGPERLRLLAAVAVGAVGAAPAVITTVSLDDLTTDGLSVASRSGDGLLLLAALAAGVVLAVVLGRRLIAAGERLALGPAGRARARRAGLVAAVAVPLIALAALAASERGIGGTISHQIDDFAEVKLDRQNDPARVLRTNSGNRWIWWEEAAGSFADRPFVGHGAGSFGLIHRAYRDNTIDVRNAHSVPLELLSETGLIGALLVLGGLGLLGVAAIRTTRARAPGRERGFAVALLAGLLAWSLHAWVDWDWEIPGVMLPVLVFLGVLAARPPRAGAHRPPPPTRGRGLALAAAGAATAVVVALAVLPARSNDLSDEALSQAASGRGADLREAAEKAALAKRLNPFAVRPIFAQASILERGNQPAAVAGLLVEAVERQPDNPDTWSRLARFQTLIDDSGAALRSLAVAASLDPVRFGAELSGLYFLHDERRSASATRTPLPEKRVPEVPAPPAPTAAPAVPAPEG